MDNLVFSTFKNFNEIKPFKLFVTHGCGQPSDNPTPSHTHNLCEVYINISGNVSFLVENHLYPIKKGSVIITRPMEWHHCIYHTNDIHNHICLFIQVNENEELFDLFFKRNKGENNLLMLSPTNLKRIIKLSDSFSNVLDLISRYISFFQIIDILNKSEISNETDFSDNFPKEFIELLSYINNHYYEAIYFNELSKKYNISISTIERYFKNYFSITPKKFVKEKRLTLGASLISEGMSVTEACFNSGYNDFSQFISDFKKQFGVTPKKYLLNK